MRSLRTSSLLVLLAFTIAACGDVGDAAEAQTGAAVDVQTSTEGVAYQIDPAQSEINWRGAKVTGSHDGGFEVFSGEIRATDSDVLSATILIDATSIFSDNERLTGHLKSDDFFHVDVNPDARFELGSIVPAPEGTEGGATHMATGNLTMAGQTNGVTFPLTVTRADDGGIQASADFIIDRQNWGINYEGRPDDLIRDEVRIMFDVVAPNAPATATDAV
jgi:polyisoprenoid-binding protein YceI